MKQTRPVCKFKHGAGPSHPPDDNLPDADFPILKTRMSPSALFNFVKSGLSDEQISDIRSMGFGGFLCIETDTVPGQLAFWLVSQFDPFTSCLSYNKLPVREEDIHLATALPIGDIPIDMATKHEQSEEFLGLVSEWKTQYGGVDKVTYSHILSKMGEQRQGGDQFKRNFVVYIVSAFLVGVKGSVPSLRILKCLRDVSAIPRLQWCEFTRTSICDSVIQWREEKSLQDKGGAAKIYKGPIMVLLYIYLDRIVFKKRSVQRVFPTLCTWTKKAITARVSDEKKVGGRFGAGFVDARLVKHPDCYGAGFVESNISIQPPVEAVAAIENDNRPRVSRCIEKMASSVQVLARAFENFSESVNEARVIMPTSTVVRQLVEMADSLAGGFNLTPPTNHESGAKEKEGEPDDKGEPNDDMRTDTLSSDADPVVNDAHMTYPNVGGIDDDPCWSDPTFLAAVCALSSAFNKESVSQPPAKKRRVAPDYPTFNLMGSQDQSVSSQEHPNVDASSSPLPIVIAPIPSKHSVHKEPKTRRDVVVSDVHKSPFVQRSISMLSELSQPERDVSDLVFRDGFDDSEVLFRNHIFQLRRSDLKSMISEKRISTNVINTWAHWLNKQEELKSAASPLRHYAFVTPNGITCKDSTDYSQLKLMFFPFTLPVPFLICVNFMNRKIEVIHPMRRRSVGCTDSVRRVREFITHDMPVKMTKFSSVQFFTYEEFVPKNSVCDGVDDGIYLMCYMETYRGCRSSLKSQVINIKTETAVEKILFKQKQKYCFAILASGHNELSEQVLTNAKRFNIKAGKQSAVQESVSYSDTHLWGYVLRPSEGDTDDIVVNTNWMQVTKKGMASLKPRGWISYMVIDMFGIYSTIRSPDLLYIPSIARNINPKRDKTLGRGYITTTYMPEDGSTLKAMFVPIFEKEHWFLCVCDLETKHNYVLNSLRTKDPEADIELVKRVVDNVTKILCRSQGYKHFSGVPLHNYSNHTVPQQTNTYDCGVHVLKWLEAGRERSLWESKDNFKLLAAFRRSVAVKLLRWSENQRKIF